MNDVRDAQLVTTDTTLPARTPVGPVGGARVVSATDVAGGGLSPAIEPRVNVTVRPATPADVAFIDKLQKAHSRELGFLPLMAIEGKIRLGQVLIAEIVDSRWLIVDREDAEAVSSELSTIDYRLSTPTPVGYLIAADRYCKRDEVGYVTQINVLPEYRRHLVAAKLLSAQFDRSAYGCRLYSCWCAQDLAANAFWEAMGFTPIAFRTGSRTKGKAVDLRSPICDLRLEDSNDDVAPQSQIKNRKSQITPRIHIFWQKRIRPDDVTTPWWYPAKTEGGEMREDRLVFPIPAGVHWRDVLPVVLPEEINRQVVADGESASRQVVENDASAASSRLADSPTRRSRKIPPAALADAEARATARLAIKERISDEPPPVKRPKHIPRGAMWAGPDWDAYEPTEAEIDAEVTARYVEKHPVRARAEKKAAPPPEKKVDPRLVEMSRELRDRWSEQTNAVAALPGKYDVRRAIAGPTSAVKMLAA